MLLDAWLCILPTEVQNNAVSCCIKESHTVKKLTPSKIPAQEKQYWQSMTAGCKSAEIELNDHYQTS